MVHSLLCDAVSLINAAFGVVLLAVTVTCLLHLIITPYFLILQAKASEKDEWIFLFVQAGWCIFHIIRMLIIVQPSYSTVAEVRDEERRRNDVERRKEKCKLASVQQKCAVRFRGKEQQFWLVGCYFSAILKQTPDENWKHFRFNCCIDLSNSRHADSFRWTDT